MAAREKLKGAAGGGAVGAALVQLVNSAAAWLQSRAAAGEAEAGQEAYLQLLAAFQSALEKCQ